jgi:hypothetical protein
LEGARTFIIAGGGGGEAAAAISGGDDIMGDIVLGAVAGVREML